MGSADSILPRALLLTVLVGFLGEGGIVDARVVRVEITHVESPTFAGRSFGDVGLYEKLIGRVFGEVDPEALGNEVIVDLQLAPRNARGQVEYVADLLILRPIDRASGNGRVFFEVNNRGRLLSLGQLNDARSGGSDPSAAEDAGNGFLMRQGYTFVSSGWDATAGSGDNRLTLTVPVAALPGGAPVEGPSLEEFVVDTDGMMTGTLTYPVATRDQSQAQLTVRSRYTDPPVAIADDGWAYIDDRTIQLRPTGTPFAQGHLYEFAYPARDPMVVGLGFAAVQDVADFLRRGDAVEVDGGDPLVGAVEHIYAFGVSQPARFLRDFVHLGFNAHPVSGRIFDGVLNWIGGGSGGFFNHRFAQPFRTHRQHIGRWYPERQFPFAHQVLLDPITGRRDGRQRRCLASDSCPKLFEVNSANEYWVKGGSLLHTDTASRDLSDPPNVRFYLFSSLPHSTGVGPRGFGMCQHPRNPLVANAGLRALLVALDQWVSDDLEPPASRVPRRAEGSLVAALPREGLGFPEIPGVRYDGLMTTGDLLDYGPGFDRGILSVLPPVAAGSPYPTYVPRTDVDGNDIAGIRLPAVAVPLATYTGWGLRAEAFAGPDLCDAAGQQIPFAVTQAERIANGDPRLSIEERYTNQAVYVAAVAQTARDLAGERLLLAEDVTAIIADAEATPIEP